MHSEEDAEGRDAYGALRRAWLDPVQVARHLYELLRADRAGVDPLPSRSERSASS